MFKNILRLALLVICNGEKRGHQWGIVGNPLANFFPCKGNDEVTITYEAGRPPEEENQYALFVKGTFPAQSKVRMAFDTAAILTLGYPDTARITADGDTFHIHFFKKGPLTLSVKGVVTGFVPYVTSIVINNEEYCEDPQTGFIDYLILGKQPSASISLTTPDDTCGRRKVEHTELIVSGLPTKPGDWPWHVALYRLEGTSLRYICGGTLLSKTLVLTAAHCVTYRGAPVLSESMNVILGKYNLVGGDTSSEERQVHNIIVHKDYNPKLLHNDIALLKLKSEVVFNDYIQPACLWQSKDYEKLPTGQLLGTVVGWGFDHTDSLSSQLQHAKMPKVPESTCLRSHPVFFSKLLTNHKFCAGYRNGTSACNGDSGGGFFVFVPDTSGDSSANATGTWHVRGIVSSSVSRTDAPICDPSHFVLFTDLAKYRGWIQTYLD